MHFSPTSGTRLFVCFFKNKFVMKKQPMYKQRTSVSSRFCVNARLSTLKAYLLYNFFFSCSYLFAVSHQKNSSSLKYNSHRYFVVIITFESLLCYLLLATAVYYESVKECIMKTVHNWKIPYLWATCIPTHEMYVYQCQQKPRNIKRKDQRMLKQYITQN